jgi:hypothetical protein
MLTMSFVFQNGSAYGCGAPQILAGGHTVRCGG